MENDANTSIPQLPRRTIVIDTETTGLPDVNIENGRRFFPSREYHHYDNARVVQIAWVIIDQDGIIREKEVHIISPDGYTVPAESTKIHGISHDMAVAEGKTFTDVALKFQDALFKCDVMVAHNMRFDMSVLLAEAYRYRMFHLVDCIFSISRFDTMWEGRREYSMSKIPKLVELYKVIFNKDYVQLHDALDDALLAGRCYVKIVQRRRSIAYRGSSILRPRASIKKPARYVK